MQPEQEEMELLKKYIQLNDVMGKMKYIKPKKRKQFLTIEILTVKKPYL